MNIIRWIFVLVAVPATFFCTYSEGYHAFVPVSQPQPQQRQRSSLAFSKGGVVPLPLLHLNRKKPQQSSQQQIGTNHKLSWKRSIATTTTTTFLLSEAYMESDLVAIKVPPEHNNNNNNNAKAPNPLPRLCVVRADGSVSPLCRHEDDVETDLFLDPRKCPWPHGNSEPTDQDVVGMYGEGWYGQRPVPSLGGGPGYGAEADEIWSVEEDLIGRLEEEGVDLPLIDVGIAHGEKARGGAF
eukprot:CAMPEP_0185727536 /NCGR_PEP_ID=MMETSP1171-20130828/3195_1 /TAXON_ID=374046 /ORGANISM="Helicotheca tamensis, Strain CCMP826" /LENGTH=239 /DNA_ID=CAMNT_0028396119 /DNA_START=72 /DNA_END=791 /DNA_ORIENTATION=-